MNEIMNIISYFMLTILQTPEQKKQEYERY